MEVVPRRIRAVGAALIAGAALMAAAPPALGASACSVPIAYPGDAAAKPAIARWMAHGARARAIPGELAVMASLVASGLANVQGGDADSVGFFQMRVGIWNAGPYAGYPEKPDLQIKWFIDQATAIRNARVAAGDLNYGRDPTAYGEWVADVQRPPENQRHLYQLRLAEARQLVGADCVGLPVGTTPPPPLPDVAIFTGSPTSVRVSKTGRFTYGFFATPGRSGKAALTSRRSIRVGAKKRKLKLPARAFVVPADAKAKVTFKLSRRYLKALKRVTSLTFDVRVTVGATAFTSKLKLRPPRRR
ncbi:MAG: hypothetical protein ACRDLS_11495 [Solirubrobacteraceae bacterium]